MCGHRPFLHLHTSRVHENERLQCYIEFFGILQSNCISPTQVVNRLGKRTFNFFVARSSKLNFCQVCIFVGRMCIHGLAFGLDGLKLSHLSNWTNVS